MHVFRWQRALVKVADGSVGMNPNPENHSIVAIFDAPTAAEDALKAVQRAGLDMRQVSVLAKAFHSDDSQWEKRALIR